jgi:hypothetical protein
MDDVGMFGPFCLFLGQLGIFCWHLGYLWIFGIFSPVLLNKEKSNNQAQNTANWAEKVIVTIA